MIETIRGQLARYLQGEIALDSFQEAFARLSWNAHRLPNEADRDFVGTIELRLAEFSNGHISEAGLKEFLLRSASFQVIAWGEPWPVRTCSTSEISSSVLTLMALSDIRLVMEPSSLVAQ